MLGRRQQLVHEFQWTVGRHHKELATVDPVVVITNVSDEA